MGTWTIKRLPKKRSRPVPIQGHLPLSTLRGVSVRRPCGIIGPREIRQNLLTQDPSFMTVLENLPNGLPNIHVAVVSSDMGAPGDSTTSIMCTTSGDNGAFQSISRGSYTNTTLASGAGAGGGTTGTGGSATAGASRTGPGGAAGHAARPVVTRARERERVEPRSAPAAVTAAATRAARPPRAPDWRCSSVGSRCSRSGDGACP
jgi:hypothetical protein